MSIRVLETEDLKKVLKIGEVIEGVRSVYEAKADGEIIVWPLIYDEFNDLMKNETIHLKYSNGTEKDVTLNTNGCATVQLKHGESVLITGLPKDGTYTVTETNASDYTVKCREGSASFETRTVISGTITSTTQVDYLNRKGAVMPTGLDFSFKAIVGAILILLVSGTAMILLNLKTKLVKTRKSRLSKRKVGG